MRLSALGKAVTVSHTLFLSIKHTSGYLALQRHKQSDILSEEAFMARRQHVVVCLIICVEYDLVKQKNKIALNIQL